MSAMVKLNDFKEYLKIKKWNLEPKNKFIKISRKFDEIDEIELLAPGTEKLPDYDSRIREIINAICILEERKFEEVFEEIANMGYDLMKLRFVGHKTENGTIPFQYFTSAVPHVETMLMYGACSEIEQKSKYGKPFDDAQELIENCEFAQTEKGSFLMSIKVPLGKTYLNEIDADNRYLEDLGRKTIARLVEGINEAEKMDISNEENFRKTYDKKLNKNVCKAISAILNTKDPLQVDVSLKWDITETADSNLPSETKLESNQREKFKNIASWLGKIPEEQEAEISGLIFKLQREETRQKLKGTHTIKIYDRKLKRNIYFYIDEKTPMFKDACNAYMEKKKIQAKGTLNKKKQGWVIDDLKDFKVLDKPTG